MSNGRAAFTPVGLLVVLTAVALGGYQVYRNLSGGEGERGAPAGRRDRGGASSVAESEAALSATSATSADAASAGTTDSRRPKPTLSLSSERLDLGPISPCEPVRAVDVVLSNESDEPLVVGGWVTSCACVRVDAEPGFRIEAGSFRSVRLEIRPPERTRRTARIDFRVEGNARGASLALDFSSGGPLLPRAGVFVRRDREGLAPLDIDRVSDDGTFLAEPFAIESVDPPVAEILPSLAPGHGAIAIDFTKIDALAAAEIAVGAGSGRGVESNGGGFRFRATPEGRRWESFEFLVRTDVPECRDLRVIVRNRR